MTTRFEKYKIFVESGCLTINEGLVGAGLLPILVSEEQNRQNWLDKHPLLDDELCLKNEGV